MTETKLLGIAFIVMFSVSFLVAGLLFWLGVRPLSVILGGTAAGIAAYVALMIFRKSYITELATEGEENG